MTEFLKPGIEEMCSILPPWLARRASSHRPSGADWIDRMHWGMEVNTASVTGFLRFWLLAKLRRWRPKSYRFAEEQRAIESWLGLISEAAQLSGDLALEVAECARLIKGYGDTHKRGTANYRLIETRVIRPVLAGQISPAAGPRRDRERAHRGAGRSRGRGAHALSRRGSTSRTRSASRPNDRCAVPRRRAAGRRPRMDSRPSSG